MLPESPSRRRFLESAAALPLAAATVTAASAQTSQGSAPQGSAPAAPAMAKRAVLISMLPAGPFADRFAAAKTAGFEAIEMQTLTDAV
jgi:hypothetical protein